MKKLTLLTAAVLACVLVAPASSARDKLTLHPAGFGSHSNAHWKAHQGLPDTGGNADQALYFQKMTTTPTFAAGAAVVRGIEGLPAEQLTGLAWDHREDGHCGAGAPRWNVVFEPDGGGSPQVLFLGCFAATHTQLASYNGHGWCRDTQPSPAAAIAAQTGQPASDFTITGLAIIFDEGNDTPNPPPAVCGQEQFTGGFVHLDNITVEVNDEVHCWSRAGDNSSGGADACPSPPAQSTGITPPGLTVPTGLPVDPLDLGMVNALGLAYPGVPLTAWRLYPNVVG